MPVAHPINISKVRKAYAEEDDELGILEDKTEALTLRSKRTERSRKKQSKKAERKFRDPLMSLPYDLLIEILTILRPREIFVLQRTSKTWRSFIQQEESRIANAVIRWRYSCLEKCFRLPVRISQVDPAIHPSLQSPERQELLNIHKKPYQHVLPPEPTEICTCLTCLLRWSGLCLIVDFAHWQPSLEDGIPIPMIPRGKNPQWNQALITRNANIVRKAFDSPLWYASLLEAHLKSTTMAIRRHAANKGNKRSRFHMMQEDLDAGTDDFLGRSGPPSYDFPFHRDNYYMLEAYLPNRSWIKEQSHWVYLPEDQHDRDVGFVVKWVEARKLAASTQQQDDRSATAATDATEDRAEARS
ncbi:hypothetical protein F4780DRAFT_687025 [Xylariomycetidae sp. FL0641]|nr:hypothetical protein F4780DRAFT_687025 [Xylariomycetidae sp. FL0641]